MRPCVWYLFKWSTYLIVPVYPCTPVPLYPCVVAEHVPGAAAGCGGGGAGRGAGQRAGQEDPPPGRRHQGHQAGAVLGVQNTVTHPARLFKAGLCKYLICLFVVRARSEVHLTSEIPTIIETEGLKRGKFVQNCSVAIDTVDISIDTTNSSHYYCSKTTT